MEARKVKLFRSRNRPEAGGETLFFHTESGDRRHPSMFFQPEDMSDFEGESGWVEIERIRGGWRVVRQVDKH
jgi:hypothetical protein